METRRITVLGITGVLILFAGGSLSGQRIVDARKGDQVKITYDSSRPKVVVGLLHDVLDNAFLVNSSTNRIVPIPRDQVTDFRVLRGQEREGLTAFSDVYTPPSVNDRSPAFNKAKESQFV